MYGPSGNNGSDPEPDFVQAREQALGFMEGEGAGVGVGILRGTIMFEDLKDSKI